MTLPKETIRQKFEPLVPPLLEPAEYVLTSAYVIPGPSPAVIGFLGAAFQYARGESDLWMAVTNRRVVFLRAAFMTQKPRGLAWADLRFAVSVDAVHGEERGGWNWFLYLRPGTDPLRLNVSIVWGEEFDEIVEELSSPVEMPPAEDWPDR
jgi:hypothetical protein